MKKLLILILLLLLPSTAFAGALVEGTNAGFCLVSPTADPNTGEGNAIDNFSAACKFTSPTSATVVTEMGWWCYTASEAANYQMAIYDHDVANNRPGNMLYSTGDIAKGTTAGYKKATGLLWAILPNTIYWLALELDNTATATLYYYTTNAAYKLDYITPSTALPIPTWGVSGGSAGVIPNIYALYETAPQTIMVTE